MKEGDKVGASEATLLNMLNISPFSYGLAVQMVYDSGTIFEPSILDIKPEDLLVTFLAVSIKIKLVIKEFAIDRYCINMLMAQLVLLVKYLMLINDDT